jgi:hypothetical protein
VTNIPGFGSSRMLDFLIIDGSKINGVNCLPFTLDEVQQ